MMDVIEMPIANFISYSLYCREVCQSVIRADRATTSIGAFQNEDKGDYHKYEETPTEINGKWQQ